MEIELHIFGNSEILTEEQRLAIYRIVQELLQNVIKHSQAHNVFVQLHIDEVMLSLTVEDNGIGFDNIQAINGMGLNNIRNRVNYLNGRLSIESEKGKGTSTYLEIDISNNI